MNIFEFFIYSFCAFVPLVAIWAAFMVYTGRWENDIECDNNYDCVNCDQLPTSLQKQAD